MTWMVLWGKGGRVSGIWEVHPNYRPNRKKKFGLVILLIYTIILSSSSVRHE